MPGGKNKPCTEGGRKHDYKPDLRRSRARITSNEFAKVDNCCTGCGKKNGTRVVRIRKLR